MTDEEIDRMADNFVNAQDFTRVYSVARKAECGAFWKYGFLAGLKAGRPKWHKVADGDFPEEDKYYLIYTDRGNYYVSKYHCNTNYWIGIQNQYVSIKNVNMDNVQKHINNAQKAVSLIQELTKKSAPDIIAKTPRPITKFFGD